MPKNVEDIIPNKKSRSIRDVPMPEERRQRARRATDLPPDEVAVKIHKERASDDNREDRQIVREYREEETTIPRMKAPLYRTPKSGRKWGRGAWVAAIVVVLLIALAAFSLFRSATLAYTQKTTPLTFNNETINAYKTGTNGVLLFSVVKISDTKSEEVPATGQTQVSTKASGSIVVYNNTSTVQKLITNTRFQSTDGHIYRIGSAISIPAKSGDTPGSLEVTVTADQPGADYNIGLTDFTVPGLKGDPRYSTIYARSKTAMSGGFVGMQNGVSTDTLSQARTDLQNQLKTALASEAEAQVPADFVIFPSLSEVSYTDLAQSTSTDPNKATVNEQGDFIGVIFKKSDLAEYIKQDKLSIPANQDIDLAGLDNLTLSFSGAGPSDLLNASQITFTASGTATAVWLTDESSLKRDLAGVSKSDLANVLKNYPGILSANAIIHPFWKTSFPTDSSEITIKKNPLK